jgi:parallel beta-helix repeat protein
MKHRFTSALFALALSALNAFAAIGTAIPGGAQSSTYVIDKPGYYYLSGDRTMTITSAAISVSADDVTLDLNGFTVSSAGGGIAANSHTNIEIRNGSVGPTKSSGIYANACTLLRIIDVRVSDAGGNGISIASGKDSTIDRCSTYGCLSDGIFSDYNSHGTAVRNCTAKDNKGRGIVLGRDSSVVHSISTENRKTGIVAIERGLIENCFVTLNNLDLNNSDEGVFVMDYCTVRGNTITGNAAYGISVAADSLGVVIENNVISDVKGVNGTRYGVSPAAVNGAKTFLANNRFCNVGLKATYAFVDGGGNVVF